MNRTKIKRNHISNILEKPSGMSKIIATTKNGRKIILKESAIRLVKDDKFEDIKAGIVIVHRSLIATSYYIIIVCTDEKRGIFNSLKKYKGLSIKVNSLRIKNYNTIYKGKLLFEKVNLISIEGTNLKYEIKMNKKGISFWSIEREKKIK